VPAHELADWPERDGLPRRGGVSSFGAGGANAHLCVEEYRAEAAGITMGEPEVIRLSAPTPVRLRELAGRLSRHVATTKPELADIAHTLRVGRDELPALVTFTATDIDELVAKLDRIAVRAELDDEPSPSKVSGDRGRRIPLPGTPLAPTRYWLPVGESLVAACVQLPAIVVLADNAALGSAWVACYGRQVVTAVPARSYGWMGEQVVGLRPDEPGDVRLLVDSLVDGGEVTVVDYRGTPLPELPSARVIPASARDLLTPRQILGSTIVASGPHVSPGADSTPTRQAAILTQGPREHG